MASACRFLIKKRETGLFYKAPGDWVKHREDATDFEASSEARKTCKERKFKEAIIVMDFGRPDLDVELPPL